MKNKFLLLGATALLSTTALMANADNASVDLDAKIHLMHLVSIQKVQDLDFGFVFFNGFGSDRIGQHTINMENEYITISPNGNVESGSETRYLGKAKQGIVVINGNMVSRYGVSLPSSVELKNGDTICGTIKNFTQGETTYPSEHCYDNMCPGIGIGGTFEVDEDILNNTAQDNFVCTGTVTVSMVYNGE